MLGTLGNRLIGALAPSIRFPTSRQSGPEESISALRFIRHDQISCGLALTSAGQIKLWQLPAATVDVYPPALATIPPLLLAHSPGAATPAVFGRGATLASYLSGNKLAIAVHSGSALFFAAGEVGGSRAY